MVLHDNWAFEVLVNRYSLLVKEIVFSRRCQPAPS